MNRALASCLLAFVTSACGSNEPSTNPVIPKSGEIVTWAGDGTQGYNGSGNARLGTWLNQPVELVFETGGTGLVVDWNNHAIRRVTADGVFVDLIGQPLPGDWPCQAPGDPNQCEVPLSGVVKGSALALNHPMDVALDEAGSFFVAAWHNHKVLQFSSNDADVTVVAGLQKPGPTGDGGPGATALFNFPSSIVRQADGSLLVSDERNNRVRRIAAGAEHLVTTVAGSMPGAGSTEDGVVATSARFSLTTAEEVSGTDNPPPGGALAVDAQGNLYVADTFRHCIRRVAAGADGVLGAGDPLEEIIETVAGTCGTSGDTGDAGDAKQARLNRPYDLEIGPDGALYIADSSNHRIRRVGLPDGVITTVAGNGKPGFSGDGGPAAEARLREPYGIAFDAAGNLFIVDTLNNRIREVLR